MALPERFKATWITGYSAPSYLREDFITIGMDGGWLRAYHRDGYETRFNPENGSELRGYHVIDMDDLILIQNALKAE